jgi:aryl-alcohol dehydrogenase-like predicted oxidoreductase
VPKQEAKIQAHRTLGRTGFLVSDVAMGTGPLRESAVVRYAYDKGINYFDTAESYGNGASERAIGEALQHMEREKVFIATKGIFRSGDDTQAVLTRVRQSLERLNTEYVDAYSMHACSTVEALSHPGYHAAIEQLKAEGRVRFTGISYHGQAQADQTGMADQLVATAEDGRFDMVLFVYNFLTHQDGDRILAACKANNVGTTAMKTSPGSLGFEAFDPENLTEEQERFVQRFERSGRGRESGLERLRDRSQRQRDVYDRTRPFAEQYGIQTEEQLQLGSIHWVLQNPDMHTACVSLNDFGLIDKVVALSGTALSAAEEEMLGQLALGLDREYCRHGCFDCVSRCPQEIPVSTIMRYAYYFRGQGREKHAMAKYAALKGRNGSLCTDCSAPCEGACTFGLDIQSNMLQVHDLLTLA